MQVEYLKMDEFYNLIRKRLESYRPKRIEDASRIPAAVLIPIYDRNGEPYLLFTKRTEQVQHHRGEICFPGGAMEEDDSSLMTTALRELQEELSIPPTSVEIPGSLDEIWTVASNFRVIPYVGLLKDIPEWKPDPLEVEKVLEVPLRHLRNPEIFRKEIRLIDQRPLPVYYYDWNEHTIWGVTGYILKSFLDLLDKEE